MAKTERKLISAPEESPDAPYPTIPTVELFEEKAADFLRAKDIEAVATLLIDEYEEDFGHLRGLKVTYAWKANGGKSAGMGNLGKCVKPSGLTKWFANSDFVIWLAADHLRALNEHPAPTPAEGQRLPATWWQIEALVFHQLKHAGWDEESGATIKHHEFEGFAQEVEEYGPWKEDIEVMRVAFRQLPFGLV